MGMHLRWQSIPLALLTAALITPWGCNGGGEDEEGGEGGTAGGGDVEHNLENLQQVLNTNADIAFAAYSDSATPPRRQLERRDRHPDRRPPTRPTSSAAKRGLARRRESPTARPRSTASARARSTTPTTTRATARTAPRATSTPGRSAKGLIDYVVTWAPTSATDQVGVTEHADRRHEPEPIPPTTSSATRSTSPSTPRSIANTATADDEHDVIAGYHAVEFMLWGQDLNADGSARTPS